jgi:transcriptional regulator GlxA family with amidase domain
MTFGFLLFPGVEELDLVGPWEIVGMSSKVGGQPDQRLLIADSLVPVRCAKGLTINPDVTFADCPLLDYLLVPGGEGTSAAADNEVLVQFIAEQATHCKAVLSVCTGSFLLHRAGLLNGRRATTHWSQLDRLRTLPNVEVVEERFTQDGPIWTSAGVSAGLDMTLAFIASVAGEATAGRVQFGAEYYPSGKRYGGMDGHEKAPAYVKRTAQEFVVIDETREGTEPRN